MSTTTKIKVAIGIPTNRGIKPKTFQSILKLVAYKDYDYEIIISTEGFTTAENRTWLTIKAINAGCTHILCLDDDMIYEEHSLELLLSLNTDIVGAVYHNRRGGEEGGDVVEYLENEAISKTTPFPCKALGGGLILIKTDVFKKIPQPWFGYKTAENGMVTMSHDWFFCEKARENGYNIWCNPKLRPGHIGVKEY